MAMDAKVERARRKGVWAQLPHFGFEAATAHYPLLPSEGAQH